MRNQCVVIQKTFVTVTHAVAPVTQKSIRVKPKYTNVTEIDVWTKNLTPTKLDIATHMYASR
jgi:hypothetical protein